MNSSTSAEESRPGVHVVGAEPTHLRGNLGVLELVFTVVAYNGPAVVFLGFLPVAIAFGNGIGTPVTFLVAGVVVGLLAAGLTTMARRLPRAGGFYSFISVGLGKVVGLGMGFSAITTYFAALLSVYALGAITLSALVRDALGGPDIAWWIYSALFVIVTTVLGHFRIDLSAKVLTVFLAIELLLITVYDIAVISQGGANGLDLVSFLPSEIFSGSVGIAFMFAIGAFGGFEATVIFRDEVRDPVRTIPRATYAVVVLLAGMYSLTAWALINAYGSDQAAKIITADPYGAASASVAEYVAPIVGDLATGLLVTSSFALMLAAHNIATRYVFNLSADGILPRSLARVHPRHGSPYRASVALSVVALVALAAVVLSGMDENLLYGLLGGTYAYCFLILTVVVAAAIMAYLRRLRDPEISIFRTTIAPGLAAIALLVGLYLATRNFSVLTGATSGVAVALFVIIYGAIALGMGMALVLRRTRPDVYARIGREETGERSETAVTSSAGS